MAISLSVSGFWMGQQDMSRSMHLPIVYEEVPAVQSKWEYRQVTVDMREEDALDIERLNTLGAEGWLLVGVLEQQRNGRSSLAHYYFVRQKLD